MADLNDRGLLLLLFCLNDVFTLKSNIPALVELLVVTNWIGGVISEEP